MSYKFDNSASYGRLRHYTSQVIGGLEARPKTAELANPFRELRSQIETERSAREAVDDALLGFSARLRVDDSDFDEGLQRVSARAYELAGKKADAEPYVTLFGRVDAKRARSFGAAKAQIVGLAVVKDGRRMEQAEAMSEALDQLEAATTRLSASKAAYDEADDALFVPRQAKKKLVAKLNEAIAVAEAGILTAFPGRGDLVNAILTPWFERRAKPKSGGDAGDDDSPDTPELEDTDVGTDT